MRVLFTDEIPDPRDIVIICLADASGVFKNILSQSELSEVQDRIELIGKMDLIGQSVIRAIREYEPPAPVPAPRKEIPQAPGLPLVGNAIGMKRDLSSLLVKQYRNLGPIFRIKAFNRRFVVLVGPEANTFVKRGGKYLRTLENWVDYNKAGGVGRNIISMDGPEHIRLRKELTDMYTHHLIEGRVGDAVHVLQQDIAGWPQDKPLHRTAMEIIRLYPLAPVMSLRTVANSFEFEGYKVPAGETLLIGFTIPHRMPEYFPNPERFDIDRYTAERAEHRQHGVYVPFGLGAHRCLGNRLAEVLIALNMATVLREAELVLHPPD